MSASGPPSTPGEGGNNNGPFQRIPSESSLLRSSTSKNGTPDVSKPPKPWERSQSALDLENNRSFRSTSTDYTDGGSTIGGKVSEHSKVYWDLSKAEDDRTTCSGGKFKISLQTIHQKEEMTSSGSPSVSIRARVVRRMASETSLLPPGYSEYTEVTLPGTSDQPLEVLPGPNSPSPSKTSKAELTFSFSNQGNKPNLTVTLGQAVPMLQENIRRLRATSLTEQCHALQNMHIMIEEAWATPTIGRDLAYGLCDVLRDDGGLEILIDNCLSTNHEIQLGSARVLEQSMTVSNREVMANIGLEVIVSMAKTARGDLELTKVTTGIMESLFKHSEMTCKKVIRLGGLDTILFSCRTLDIMTLRHCAEALANLAMFGGEENQQEMILHKAAEWLFPLAFSNDDNIRYYAFLAIAALSANKELESAVVKSGTLELVQPFILTHDPADFAQSDKAHIHGQSKNWLRRLVKLLSSQREEAQSLAAFHFAMEAGIKADQGQGDVVCIHAERWARPLLYSQSRFHSQLLH